MNVGPPADRVNITIRTGVRNHPDLRRAAGRVKDSFVKRTSRNRDMAHGHDSLLELPRDLSADEPRVDVRGFEAFSREQYGSLLQFLRLRTSEEDARDIAQESVTRLLRYRDTEPASAWRPLLYRIARNLLNEQYRRSQSRKEHQNVPLDTIEVADPAPPLELVLMQEQQEAWLRAAMLALPPRCRQVFVLCRVDGLSHAEVARRCGISVKTVEKHLTKALAALCDKAGVWDSNASS